MEKSAAVAKAIASIDTARVVELVRQVCRIPSVLGDEKAFAEYLFGVMKDSGFTDVHLQDVLPDRPNAVGELDFGAGPRVVFTGHLDTKPVSIGWTEAEPFSGDLIDGHVYGHGIMDMKAALVCQLVAAEAVRSSGVPVSGRLGFAGVSDHMGDQLGSIRYFDSYSADLCVLGELSDNEIYLGHRGRYYFDITAQGLSAHTCHKPLAVNANMLAAKAIIELDASRLTPELEPWVRDLFGEETYMAPGRVYGGLPPGGPSMIPDECVIRLDCRPQPGVSVETVRAELDRCLDNVARVDPRFRARIELADVKSGYVADPETTVVQTMVEAVREVRGTEPPLKAAGWLGDTASFGDKIPTVIFGPGGEPVYCPNERLSVDDIVEATQVYTAFATLALLS
ncbi:M20 family metallopeptidase [Amycolatopsis acidicola]|nr:M20/M25/M40 family metallo-hydrolase [Amycolatopsis acidicola]